MKTGLLILFLILAINNFGQEQNYDQVDFVKLNLIFSKFESHKKIFSDNQTEKPKVEIENYNFFKQSAPAMNLPKPRYPQNAKAKKISGTVKVEIVVDENGKVIWTKALSGPKILRKAAVETAQKAIFTPIKINGSSVKVSSIIPFVFKLK